MIHSNKSFIQKQNKVNKQMLFYFPKSLLNSASAFPHHIIKILRAEIQDFQKYFYFIQMLLFKK